MENHVKTNLVIASSGAAVCHSVGFERFCVDGYRQGLRHALCTHAQRVGVIF